MKYFAINQNSCISNKTNKEQKQKVMRTFKKALKEAIKKANEIHGFVIDNAALSILFVKVESNYSDEYITKKAIRYKLSSAEKAERALEDEKKEKEISKGLSFLNF